MAKAEANGRSWYIKILEMVYTKEGWNAVLLLVVGATVYFGMFRPAQLEREDDRKVRLEIHNGDMQDRSTLIKLIEENAARGVIAQEKSAKAQDVMAETQQSLADSHSNVAEVLANTVDMMKDVPTRSIDELATSKEMLKSMQMIEKGIIGQGVGKVLEQGQKELLKNQQVILQEVKKP